MTAALYGAKVPSVPHTRVQQKRRGASSESLSPASRTTPKKNKKIKINTNLNTQNLVGRRLGDTDIAEWAKLPYETL